MISEEFLFFNTEFLRTFDSDPESVNDSIKSDSIYKLQLNEIHLK